MWKLRTLFVLAAVITLLLSRFVFNSTVRLFPKNNPAKWSFGQRDTKHFKLLSVLLKETGLF